MRFSIRAFAVSAVLLCLAAPSAVEAAMTSAVAGSTATMTGDDGATLAHDFLTITQSGGLFRHNRFTGGAPGFSSDFDFDTAVPGNQTIDAATGVININTRGGDDFITLGDGVNLRGTIDGGAGKDSLDYEAYSTGISVNLGLGTTGLSATLGPEQQVPPVTGTATGTVTVTNYNLATRRFDAGTPSVTGGAGTDTLTYDAETRAVSGDTTPPDGTIDSPGVQSVAFFQIETVNIANASTNPEPSIAIADVTVAEGRAGSNNADFTVTLSHAHSSMVSVGFTTANGTAVAPGDYSSNSGGVIFFPGETVRIIRVPVLADALSEPPETFFVNLSNPTNATIADSQAVGTIVNGQAPSDDADGDGKADLVVFRPPSGTWFTLPSSTGFTGGTSTAFGAPGDLPVSGLYDADTKTDVAVYRPSNGTWYILQSSTGTTESHAWGAPGDRPVPGDYDGDGTTDVAVFRPSTGVWYIRWSSSLFQDKTITVGLGLSTDIPVPADYDGDGTTDVAVYRPSTGLWSIRKSSTGGVTSLVLHWGAAGDVPVPGDYDGDGLADAAVYRPSTGTWFLLQSSTGYSTSRNIVLGTTGDLVVPADYDGDQRTDVAIFEPGTGSWTLLKSSTDFTAADVIQWGLSGDIPAPAAPIRAAIAAAGGQPTLSTLANRARESDFDLDGRADLSIWRPSTGAWYILHSSTNYSTFRSFFWGYGPSGDVTVPGDYDGDGVTDFCVWRHATGEWFIASSSGNLRGSFPWGQNGDVPVPGDYDGDGRTDFAIYRSNGVWFIRESRTNFGTSLILQFSAPGGIPVPGGDYDGDGLTDLALWRPSTGEWSVLPSGTGFTTRVTFQWGLNGDVAVPGDYDGDGRTDFAVYRPSTGTWFVAQSGTSTMVSYQWGLPDDIPVAGDYDGDGRSDVAVFRPSTGTWFILTSSSDFTTGSSVVWGGSGDIPILRRQ